MITKIKTISDTLVSEKLFFTEANLTALPNPRIIPLFGPNGAGKTTLIDAIMESLMAKADYEQAVRENDDPEIIEIAQQDMDKRIRRGGCELETDGKHSKFLHYANGRDNFRNREPRSYMESFDPWFLSARFDARSMSEGQSIVYSVYDLFDLMGTGKNAVYVDDGDLIILIDELDSGLSIDNLDMFMRKLRRVASRRKDVQVIFSYNNPRILKYFPDCLSLYDGRPVHLENADDMLTEIKAHEKEFNRARKKSNGRPRVYA